MGNKKSWETTNQTYPRQQKHTIPNILFNFFPTNQRKNPREICLRSISSPAPIESSTGSSWTCRKWQLSPVFFVLVRNSPFLVESLVNGELFQGRHDSWKYLKITSKEFWQVKLTASSYLAWDSQLAMRSQVRNCAHPKFTTEIIPTACF